MVEVIYKTHRKKLTLPKKRKTPTKARAFKAAQSRLTESGWMQSSVPADYDIRYGLETLRARSREESENSDHVKQFIRMVKTNIVGPNGVAMQGAVKMRRSGRLDERANDALEMNWKEWGAQGSPDTSGLMSWVEIQNATVAALAIDGEAIWRKVPRWEGNKYGFALQQLDAALLDIQYNEELGDGRAIVMGIELDSWRRPVAYHMLDRPRPNWSMYGTYYGGKRQRIPANEIYHIYLREWCLQSRGVPWTAPGLRRLHNLVGYEDAELVAARVAAAKMGFFEQESTAGQYVGDDEDAQQNPIQDARPGEFEVLPQGWTFKDWDPQHPNTAYGEFVRSCLRSLASGLGVNYNTLANDLTQVNYTSLRHGLLIERDVWMTLQNHVIQSFIGRVYNDWLTEALLSGELVDVGGRPLLMSKVDDYRRVNWQGRRWQWVDPLKESQARQTDLNMGIRSRSQMIREDGRDPEEVWQEIAAEQERMKELGIQLSVEGGGSQTSDDDDESEDEKDGNTQPANAA